MNAVNEFDEPPQPVGGFAAVAKNLRYPEVARKLGVEGRVLVHLRVDANGDIAEANIVQSIRDDMDAAAIKALKRTKWVPAKLNGKAVAAEFDMPVIFKLAGGKRRGRSRKMHPLKMKIRLIRLQKTLVHLMSHPNPSVGFEAIQRNLVYPEESRKARIEGRVLVHVRVDLKGKIIGTKILESVRAKFRCGSYRGS